MPERRSSDGYGPCGFGIYRYLTNRGEACVVVSPSMVPKRSGDRVKTDRRDSVEVARADRAGALRGGYMPGDAGEERRGLVGGGADARGGGAPGEGPVRA